MVRERGDAPAGTGAGPVSGAPGSTPVKLLKSDPFERWAEANVVRGVANGTVSAYAFCDLGDIGGRSGCSAAALGVAARARTAGATSASVPSVDQSTTR